MRPCAAGPSSCGSRAAASLDPSPAPGRHPSVSGPTGQGSSQRTQRRTTKDTAGPRGVTVGVPRSRRQKIDREAIERTPRTYARSKPLAPAPSCPLCAVVFVVMNLRTGPSRRRPPPLTHHSPGPRFSSQFRPESLYVASLGATRIRVPETVRSRRPDCRLHRPSRRAFHRPN